MRPSGGEAGGSGKNKNAWRDKLSLAATLLAVGIVAVFLGYLMGAVRHPLDGRAFNEAHNDCFPSAAKPSATTR